MTKHSSINLTMARSCAKLYYCHDSIDPRVLQLLNLPPKDEVMAKQMLWPRLELGPRAIPYDGKLEFYP